MSNKTQGNGLIGWLRRIASRGRTETRRVARVAYRFRRTSEYLLHLLVWSRVFAARRNLARATIPPKQLRRKGVACAQPQLRVRAGEHAEAFENGFRAINDILFANLRRADMITAQAHAVPGPAFSGVYLWDSAFIAQIWKIWDRETARKVLASVVELREGDRLQHVVADFVKSAFTQPPLITWSLAELLQAQPRAALWREAIEDFYAPLRAYGQWLDRHRLLSNGLYFWEHPYESGVENAPRFSNRDESQLRDTRSIAAPDLCAYRILQLESLGQLATFLDRTEEARQFHDRARGLQRLTHQMLWHSADGLYYDRHTDGTWIRSRTIASLMPMVAGVPGVQEAQRLRQAMMDPNVFGSLIPLPSVALDDPDFCRDMWRGPVWINTAYLALQGLRRYGFEAEAATLAWRLCVGVYEVLRREHQVYEFYDPEHYHTRLLKRKDGNRWKAITLGNRPQKEFVGWSGLVNTLIVEFLCGIRPVPGGIEVRPALPPEARGHFFVFELPQEEGLCVEVDALEGGDFRLRAIRDGQTRESRLAFGQSVVFEFGPPAS